MQQKKKKMKDYITLWLSGEADPLGTVQEIEIWYMYNQEAVLENETYKHSGILRYKRIT